MRLVHNALTIAAVTMAALAAIVVLCVGPSAADPTGTPATIHAAHIGAKNPGFTTGSCPSSPDGTWGWHFVLPDNDTNFVSISATFAYAGTVTSFISHPTGHHAYVYTHQADTLLGATAMVDGLQTWFNLSHVCTGTNEPEDPPTTTEPPTTTMAPTTTLAPTTTVAPTTIKSVSTTVAEQATPTVSVLGAVAVAPAAQQPSQLAFTGARTVRMLMIGSSLLTVGALLTSASRRRAVRTIQS